jgi:ATP-dependent Clp protease ATP-binding subunit ClpC
MSSSDLTASGVPTYQPRVHSPTPTLDLLGVDLTRMAQEGTLTPLIDREAELELVIETLCRRSRRNPVLVGPAGVGKTAIAQGLAQRIVQGQVPQPLQGVRLIALQPSALAAGTNRAAELPERIQAILTEAAQNGIILFIDDIHAPIGTDNQADTRDLAPFLKPALARGALTCLAATTDDQYRAFVESDAVLERHFQPVRVQPPTAEQTLAILTAQAKELARLRHLRIADEVLPWLIDFAEQHLRNRHFPEKAVDLLEQCVAHAIAHGKTVVDQGDAETVAQRTIGMPLGLTERLARLRSSLEERGLLPADAMEALVNHLQVSLRGLALRPVRPKAVVLRANQAGASGELLSACLAENLFSDASRLVVLDFSQFTQAADVSALVGAPPGHAAAAEPLPLHRVAQLNWCVLLCQNVDACHPHLREVLTQALASGYLTEARGRRIYLSDTVVVLTAAFEVEESHTFGFTPNDEPAAQSIRRAAAEVLGPLLVAQCDLVVPVVGVAIAPDRRRWYRDHLLAVLTARYRQQGVEVRWDDSLVEWLAQIAGGASARDLERLVDDYLSPLLVRHLPVSTGATVPPLLVKFEGDEVRVEPVTGPG